MIIISLNEICPICLGPVKFKSNTDDQISRPCDLLSLKCCGRRTYHKTCYFNSQDKRCPVCRREKPIIAYVKLHFIPLVSIQVNERNLAEALSLALTMAITERINGAGSFNQIQGELNNYISSQIQQNVSINEILGLFLTINKLRHKQRESLGKLFQACPTIKRMLPNKADLRECVRDFFGNISNLVSFILQHGSLSSANKFIDLQGQGEEKMINVFQLWLKENESWIKEASKYRMPNDLPLYRWAKYETSMIKIMKEHIKENRFALYSFYFALICFSVNIITSFWVFTSREPGKEINFLSEIYGNSFNGVMIILILLMIIFLSVIGYYKVDFEG